MSIFYSGSLISGAFGSLIAAGILNGLGHSRGLSPWQWLYIIEGVITVGVGVIVILVLPDFPDTWKSLPAELKHVANRRLAIEAAEADVDEAGAMSQLKGFKVSLYTFSIDFLLISPACHDRREHLHSRNCLYGYYRSCWLSKFLSDLNCNPGLHSNGVTTAVCTALHIHHNMGSWPFLVV